MSESIPVFDTAAKSYDKDFTNSMVGRLQRNKVWDYLRKYMTTNKPLEILEINCGTGEDSFWLASHCHHIEATDISSKMIEIAKSKMETIGSSPAINFSVSSFKDLKVNFNGKQFDMVISDFSGLNCLSKEELQLFSNDISDLIKPEGKLIVVLFGKLSFWEILYFSYKGKFKTAFRRFSDKGVDTVIDGFRFRTYYYSSKSFRKVFKLNFDYINKCPIGLFLPPSYLGSFFNNKTFFLNTLNALETFFGRIPIFADCSDHYIIEFKKNE